jgi:hypothetical protein
MRIRDAQFQGFSKKGLFETQEIMKGFFGNGPRDHHEAVVGSQKLGIIGFMIEFYAQLHQEIQRLADKKYASVHVSNAAEGVCNVAF